MKKSCVSVLAAAVVAFATSGVFGLEIRVAPKTLVLSSDCGSVTVHTDFPYELAVEVVLQIEGTEVDADTFKDNRGNLVAQCTKDAAKAAIGEVEKKFTTATVTLTVDGDSDSRVIRVKK